MEKPLVSIILACYNHSKFVVQNLNSIKSQTYDNIQLIISDDASTDNTTEIIENWLEDNGIAAIKNFQQINKGLPTILNECMLFVKGKYLKIIAADDYLNSDSIERCVNKLEELGNEYAIYYGDINIVNENNEPVIDRDSIKFPPNYVPLHGNCFVNCVLKFPFWAQAALFRYDYLKGTNFRFNKNYFSEDWHLILHLSRIAKVAGETTVFATYRILSTSITSQNWNEKKLPKIYFSWFNMIITFLNKPNNTEDENRLIEEKLFSLLLEIYPSTKKLKIELALKYLRLFWDSKNKYSIIRKMPILYNKLRN